LVAKYKESPLAEKGRWPKPPEKALEGKAASASWFLEFLLMFRRGMLQTYRNPVLTVARALTNFWLALLLGALFFQLDNSQASVQDRLGAIFITLMSQTLPVAMNVVAVCKFFFFLSHPHLLFLFSCLLINLMLFSSPC
jgi:hypothetical protein